MSEESDSEPRSGGSEAAPKQEGQDAESEPDGEDKPRAREERSGSRQDDRRSSSKARRSSAEAVAEPDENVVNAPTRQTLGMLSAVAIITLIMWAAGRAACNLHPPRETRRPREVKTEELARTPKDAALEIQQRWLTLNFKGARELAKGTLSERIAKEQKACEAEGSPCDKRRERLERSVATVAELFTRDADTALARAISTGGADGPKSFRYSLERDGRIWKATARLPDEGPVPKQAVQQVPMRVMPLADAGAPSATDAGPGSAAKGEAPKGEVAPPKAIAPKPGSAPIVPTGAVGAEPPRSPPASPSPGN